MTRYVIVVAVTGCLLAVAAARSAGPTVAAAAVAFGFLVSELGVVHLQVGRSAFSITLHETVLVVALFAVRPSDLLIGVLLGPLLGMGMQRIAPIKVAFNLGQYLIWASLACLARRLLPANDLFRWAVVLFGVLLLSLLTAVLIAVAIRLADATSITKTLRESFLSSQAISAVCGSLGLLSAPRQGAPLDRLWLLVPVGVSVYFGHLAHQTLRAQRTPPRNPAPHDRKHDCPTRFRRRVRRLGFAVLRGLRRSCRLHSLSPNRR